jgi:hypothetical protein
MRAPRRGPRPWWPTPQIRWIGTIVGGFLLEGMKHLPKVG